MSNSDLEMRRILLLTPLRQYSDLSLLLLRLLTGGFLVHGVWDNITSAERMTEFVDFLISAGFIYPEFMARLSVWSQLLIGLSLLAGALTRWAGLLCAFNFCVAVWMVHWTQDFRSWWPAIVLVGLGLYFATRGAGRYSVDDLLQR